MEIIERNAYIGPNIYWSRPVIRLEIAIAKPEITGDEARSFGQKLAVALPLLASRSHARSFAQALQAGVALPASRAFQHMALELQNMAGYAVAHGSSRPLTGSRHEVIYAYEERRTGMEAAELTRTLLASLLAEDASGAPAGGFNWNSARDRFIRFAQRHALDPSAAALIVAAEARDIPWIRLNAKNLAQLGHGCNQRRIQATITSQTRSIAVSLANRKADANRILRDLGLPAPALRVARSAEEAARAAAEIGLPATVRPVGGDEDRGMSRNLTDEAAVRAAYDLAAAHGDYATVSAYTEGAEYRLLAVNGELAAAVRLAPGNVVGDGERTVAQLLDRLNRDPRRGIGAERPLTRLELDPEAEQLMHRRGVNRDTVLPKGEVLRLRSIGRLATGGEAIDVTDAVHPDNREIALRAVKAIGLDVAGVDFIAPDICQSYRENGGKIVDIAPSPDLRAHLRPTEGKPRDVAAPIIDMLFPPGAPARVPIAAVAGANGKTTTARMAAHILKLTGRKVAAATSDGVLIGGVSLTDGDYSGPLGANIALRDPTVEAAVLECTEESLYKEGLGFRRSTAAACLSVSPARLHRLGAGTMEDAARVMRLAVESAVDIAILNADDPYCLRMADHCRAKRIGYVSLNPDHELAREHVRRGGLAFLLEAADHGQTLTLRDRGARTPLLRARLVPATLDGKAPHMIQNALFAAALAYSLGVNAEDIRHGLGAFDNSYFQAPGRTTVLDDQAFRVILDSARNAAAVQAVCRTAERMAPKGRKLCLLAAPGDLCDDDIRAIAHRVAGRFDAYVCRDDDDSRGRQPGETPRLLREELIQSGVRPSNIQVIAEEVRAVAAVLRMAKPDDLALIFGGDIPRCWEQIKNFKPHSDLSDMATHALTDVGADPEIEPFELAPGERLIRDERGVRIAKFG